MYEDFSPRTIAEAQYLMEDCGEMFPGWVYSFRTRKQWMPPYTTIRVKPKQHIWLKVMDIHLDYVFVSVVQESFAG